MSDATHAAPVHVSAGLSEPLPRALLILTAATGLIDAVSYLGLGHVFSANMTGNIVLLGFGVAGTGGLPVLSPLLAAIAFLAGAGAGGLLAARTTLRGATRLSRALVIEIALIVVAAALAAILDVRPNEVSGDAIVMLLALAMGVRNATVRRLGVPDLTTTVLTLTLTGIAADSPAAGGTGAGTVRRVGAVVAMFAGAVVGALLIKNSLVTPLIAAAALSVVAWLVVRERGAQGAAAKRAR